MTRQNTLPVLLSAAMLLAPSVLHAQAVGGFVRRPGTPATPPPAAPVYNSAPTNNTNTPTYSNNSPAYNSGPVYRPAPSAPIGAQSAPMGAYANPTGVYTNRSYSNAPVYQNAPVFRSGPAAQNGPVYQTPYPNNSFVYQNNGRNNAAGVYRGSPVRRTPPAQSPVSGNPNAPIYTIPVFTGRAYRVTTPHGPP